MVAVEDVLRALDAAGPLATDALARQLDLDSLEARMVLLHAHWHGLVRASRHGEWAISPRGRALLAGRLGPLGLAAYLRRLRASASALAWRRRLRPGYVARGGVSLALGAVVCLAGVAMASSSLPIGGPPVLPPTHVKRIRHHRHRHLRLEQRAVYSTTGITTQHRHDRSPVTVTVTRIPGVQHQRVASHHRTRAASCVKLRATSQRRSAGGRHPRAATSRHRSVQRC